MLIEFLKATPQIGGRTMFRFMLKSMLALSLTAASAASQGPGLKGKPEDNPAETRKYLLSLGWGDDYATDAIVEAPFDIGGGNTALIRIVPMTHANQVSWQSALGIGMPGGDGAFVAKIYNLEDKPIGALGIGRLGTGYLWVGEVQGGRGAAIYSFKNNGTLEGQPKKLTLGGYCKGQHFDSRVELTDGKKCTGPFAPISSTTASIAPKFFFASSTTRAVFVGKGLWVTCLGGCCEIQT
jgi:hypothetical protein